ncbi:hypothetical protein KP509_33G058800 [Ceratopteris richardii]|uniref:Uncharacterized protein n=1 Tax=Ceratopteris richardii TaxID=49495 RepID=A0A8T2QR94_CERRI|nr:hypothetical protein KP509_33G058800 [Ceratopteris richardii]
MEAWLHGPLSVWLLWLTSTLTGHQVHLPALANLGLVV